MGSLYLWPTSSQVVSLYSIISPNSIPSFIVPGVIFNFNPLEVRGKVLS